MDNIFDELKWRGLVYDATENVPEMLAHGPVSVYNGFDATSDSLHVGHMAPLVALARLQRFGHIPIPVAGGRHEHDRRPERKIHGATAAFAPDHRSQS